MPVLEFARRFVGNLSGLRFGFGGTCLPVATEWQERSDFPSRDRCQALRGRLSEGLQTGITRRAVLG